VNENDPAMPTDTPLIRVLADVENEGYEAQFVPRPDGMVLCRSGGHEFAALDVLADQERRLEGVSDPADMLIVYALRCPICGAAGTLVLHYGPEASADEADVLVAIDVRPRRTDVVPGSS
jgi:hypothetical protein